ncbi:glycosyltransferase family 4 protein [Sphingoaurantiacus capsulatus]
MTSRPDIVPLAGIARSLSHIAVIGNALPRRCGLATFTQDTVSALRGRFPDLTVDHYAMDDGTDVSYPSEVKLIEAAEPLAYREAAGLIEASAAEAIWLQHEFGIFGGDAGAHILTLIERTTLPLIATLHTVLDKPSASERQVMERLIDRASHLIVMAESARAILRDTYGVPAAKISVIPHGVPDRAYVEPDSAKGRFGLEGRKVVMTFGLLGPDKGIRHMIEAMPAIVAAEPRATYVVIGATHPNLVRQEGEAHRNSLKVLAMDLGVADHVRFVDTFLDYDDLLDWLEAADVYVTPYLNLAQITSGTLSYAVALGKPVVSTPYRHAAEILADDRGVLVPPQDAGALAEAVGGLLSDDMARAAMAAGAYELGRDMLWPRAAARAVALAEKAIAAVAPVIPAADTGRALAPDLTAVRRMSDSTGIFQHGIYSIPDRHHGYCVDDNARALILLCRAGDAAAGEDFDRLATVYAAFVQHAWNPDASLFRNFMGFDRQWCETEGSEDSNGRTLWALGTAAAQGRDRAMRDWAIHLYDHTAYIAGQLGSPRARAFAALGAAEVLAAHPGHAKARATLAETGDLLHRLLVAARRPDWSWFEAVLAYDNARLPEALIRAGHLLGREDFLTCGLETLDWIREVQTNKDGDFRPVGSDSFGREYAAPLPFDQQPLEAQAQIDACVAAHAATGDKRWLAAARQAYGWFVGENDLGLALADRITGGCHDGLMPHGLNRNQGAESILALQLANVTISALPFATARGRTARDAA